MSDSATEGVAVPRALIGIDVGTSTVKVVAVTSGLQEIAAWSRGYESSRPEPGAHEQDPAVWWALVVEGLRRVVDRLDGHPIAAIGVSGHMHSLLLLDDDDEPVAPAMTWADRRDQAEADRLRRQPNFLRKTGNEPSTTFTAPKVAWMRRRREALSERATRLLAVKDYVRLKLSGDWSTDRSDAIGTQLYDITSECWDAGLLAAVGAPIGMMPRVRESTEVCGTLTEEASQATGVPSGTPIVTGAGDVTSAFLGTSTGADGEVCINAGTAAQVMAATPKTRVSPAFLFGSPWSDLNLAMAPVYAAGASVRWFEHAFLDDATLGDVAGKSRVGANGLGYLPFMLGAAVPLRSDGARARYYGQSAHHTVADFARATIEGVAFGCADAVSAVIGTEASPSRIRVTGGVSRSAIWCEALSAVWDVPVERAARGGSALGAAMLAGLGVGVWESLQEAAEFIPASPVSPPDAGVRRSYEAAWKRYEREARAALSDDA